jgi:hypothetical protein
VRDAHNDIVVDVVADVVDKDYVDMVEDVVDSDVDATARRTRKGGAAARRGDAAATLMSVEVHAYLGQPSQIRTYRNGALIG